MNKYAIIVAGGKGTRMKSNLPKQFLRINGLPVLMHTIHTFREIPSLQIILVLPSDQFSFWKELCIENNFESPTLVCGGRTRYHSVQNGLNSIQENGFVAIHDGVRPIITKELILSSFEEANIHSCAVLAVSLKDSIRQKIGDQNISVDRSNYFAIQTPQTFNVSLLKKAYQLPYQDSFTDDASVFEAAGNKITLIEGDYQNIKITTPEDIIIAQTLLIKQKS